MNNSHHITVTKESDIQDVTSYITPFFQKGLHILLYGDLGAGKTTFTKHFLHHLGIEEEISSPTYSIVNEYKTDQYQIAHIDLYRLESEHDALEIGIEDYLYRHQCIIEWPQIIEDLLENFMTIQITVDGENRIFEIKTP